MSDQPYSRRDFLLRLGLAGAALPLLGACGVERSPATAETAAALSTSGRDPEPSPRTAAGCPGHDELTEDEVAARARLRYVDESPEAGQRCDNCALVVDEPRFKPCTGCRALPGPVAPRGWCAAWVAQG